MDKEIPTIIADNIAVNLAPNIISESEELAQAKRFNIFGTPEFPKPKMFVGELDTKGNFRRYTKEQK